MYRFHAGMIRNRDEDGRLVSCGVLWTNDRTWGWYPIAAAMFLLALGWVHLDAQHLRMLDGLREKHLQMAGIGAVVLALFVLSHVIEWWLNRYWWLNRKKSALIFTDEGGLLTPYGLVGWRRTRSIDGDHANILNIGLDQGFEYPGVDPECNFDVNLYIVNGDIIRVAANLTKGEAHKVTVLLTHAIAEMRKAMARMTYPQQGQAVQAGPAPGRAKAVLID